jgi:hypothetical protein
MHRAFKVGFLALAALLPLVGCSLDNSAREKTIKGESIDSFFLDSFTVEVMPVLLRDCGFQGCHGSPERFFRVWGPGRTRYEPNKTVCEKPGFSPPCNWDPITPLERDYSLQFARAMVDLAKPEDSLLLRKPLAVERGGADHEGVDKYGRNVYRTPDEEGFSTLARWVYAYADSQNARVPAAPTPAATAGAPATIP